FDPFPVVEINNLRWGLNKTGYLFPVKVVLNCAHGESPHLRWEYRKGGGESPFGHIFNGVGITVNPDCKDFFIHRAGRLSSTLGHGVTAPKDQIKIGN